jgi:hypothetical protein
MADETPLPSDDETPTAPANPYDLSEDGVRQWKARVSKDLAKQKNYHGWWEAAIKAYSPQVNESPDKYGTCVRTNRVYTIVERKSAELFYQRPDLTVTPSPLLDEVPGGPDVAFTHASILNEKLGLDGVNIKDIARRAIFDYLMFGAGWTLMGYRTYTKDVPVPVTDLMGQPVMDEFTGQPVTEMQPVPVKSECFIEGVSPKQVIIPNGWNSTNYDKGPYLGWRFKMSLTAAKRVFTLPEDFKGSMTNVSDDMEFDHGGNSDTTPPTDIVTGTQLWYRTSEFRDDEIHPDHLTELVIIDGIPTAAKHEAFKCQSFDARGRLTPDSLVGFPLQALVIRAMTDAAYLMSDVAVGLPLINELDVYREQMVKQREITLTRAFYDTDKIGKDSLDKLIRAAQGGMIGLPHSAFIDGLDPVRALPMPPYHPDNYQANAIIDQDLSRTHAVDSLASGVTSGDAGLTATEANLRQANVNVRLGWEQSFVADWFITLSTKFSTILQKFLSVEDAAQIVGMAKAQQWDVLRKTIPTRFAFTMTPDSSLRNDTPLDRKQLQDLYTFLANDPALNRRHLAEKLALKYHLDPSPQPKPPVPTSAIAFKGDDFNPMNPQAPIMMDLWQKIAGIPIDPAAIENAMALGVLAQAAQKAEEAEKGAGGTPHDPNPPHGGKVAAVEGLSKHATDLTGAMQGSGQMVPGMAGGGVQ